MAAGQGSTNAMMKYGEMTVQGDIDTPTSGRPRSGSKTASGRE
jgi:hypothetical protein